MIIELWNDELLGEAQHIIRIKAKQEGNDITLMAVDKRGNRLSQGDLLIITPKGVIFCSDISPDLKFDLDKYDRLKNLSE